MVLEGVLISLAGDHHHHTRHADQSPEDVPQIRPEPIHQDAPGQRQGDEYATVGVVSPPDLRDRLQGSHHYVGCEDGRP